MFFVITKLLISIVQTLAIQNSDKGFNPSKILMRKTNL